MSMSTSRPQWVYFARPIGMEGPVKIGASNDPKERLKTLMAWSPFPLEVATAIPGNYALERNIHECFAEHHSHHEWFSANPRLTKLIADLQAGVQISEAIDLSARVGAIRKFGNFRRTASQRMQFSYSQRISQINRRAKCDEPGCIYGTPTHIDSIIKAWCWGNRRTSGNFMPSAADIAALDDYIVNPKLTKYRHILVPTIRHDMVAQ